MSRLSPLTCHTAFKTPQHARLQNTRDRTNQFVDYFSSLAVSLTCCFVVDCSRRHAMWASALSAPSIGPGYDQDAAIVLKASAPFNQLVRLTVGAAPLLGAPSGAVIARSTLPPGRCAPDADECLEDDDQSAAIACRLEGCALSQALVNRLRSAVPEVRDWCVARAQAPNAVQLTCPKVCERVTLWARTYR